jgi:hypothetical protein
MGTPNSIRILFTTYIKITNMNITIFWVVMPIVWMGGGMRQLGEKWYMM